MTPYLILFAVVIIGTALFIKDVLNAPTINITEIINGEEEEYL